MTITHTKLAEARARFAARRREVGFLKAVTTEGGAIDLASIMVGVIIIGIIGGVIAATVFAVIPWAQDSAAGQSLDAVVQAESVAYAQGAQAGTSAYMPKNTIVATDGAGGTNGLLQAAVGYNIHLATVNGKPGYIGVSKSATGAYFWVTNLQTKAQKVAFATDDATTLAALATKLGGTIVSGGAGATAFTAFAAGDFTASAT